MEATRGLDGRVAIVTGGRRGLGAAMARGLAAAGAKIAVVAKSDSAGPIADEIRALGVDFHYVRADLCSRAERRTVVDDVLARFGRVDVLVNNAGVQRRAEILDYPDAQWDEDMSLLLGAVFELSRAAAKPMIAQGGGKIVHIASISSFQGARGIIGYATAKHGLVGMTKCMANEWARFGVNVNAIAPGIFETEMAAHVLADPAKSAELKGRIPAGRFGRPEDLVGPLLFLATDASRHVHGTTLLVDGGWMGR